MCVVRTLVVGGAINKNKTGYEICKATIRAAAVCCLYGLKSKESGPARVEVRGSRKRHATTRERTGGGPSIEDRLVELLRSFVQVQRQEGHEALEGRENSNGGTEQHHSIDPSELQSR